MHFLLEKDNKVLQKMIGKDSAIAEKMEAKEEEHDRYEVFEAIDTLVDAARQLYCDEDLEWDMMCDELCAAVEKLKGKEKKLEKLAQEAEEDEE